MGVSIANLRTLGATVRTPPVRPRRPRIFNFAFTFGGAAFIGVSVLVGLAAVSAEANMLYVCFGLCLGAMIVSGTLSTRAIMGIVVTRENPQTVCVGQPFELRYLLTNTKRRSRCYSVRLKETTPAGVSPGPCEGYATRIDAGETVALAVPARCDRRGRVRLREVVVATRFPFGMFTKFARAAVESEIFVLPALGRLRQPLLPQASDAGGGRYSQRRPHGWLKEEFYGLREYRRGDNPKLIHWRRSARMGELIVREMRDDPRRQLIVILNPFLNRGAAGFSLREPSRGLKPRGSGVVAVERAIECAATCCVTGLESGFLVGLMILGKSPLIMPPAAGVEHRLSFLKNLAMLEASGDFDPLEAAVGIRWRSQWQGHGLLIGADEAAVPPKLASVFARRCQSLRVFATGTDAFNQFFEPGGSGATGSLSARAVGVRSRPTRRSDATGVGNEGRMLDAE